MIGEKINLTGKVISIDKATKTVVVEGERGQQVSIQPRSSLPYRQPPVTGPIGFQASVRCWLKLGRILRRASAWLGSRLCRLDDIGKITLEARVFDAAR